MCICMWVHVVRIVCALGLHMHCYVLCVKLWFVYMLCFCCVCLIVYVLCVVCVCARVCVCVGVSYTPVVGVCMWCGLCICCLIRDVMFVVYVYVLLFSYLSVVCLI